MNGFCDFIGVFLFLVFIFWYFVEFLFIWWGFLGVGNIGDVIFFFRLFGCVGMKGIVGLIDEYILCCFFFMERIFLFLRFLEFLGNIFWKGLFFWIWDFVGGIVRLVCFGLKEFIGYIGGLIKLLLFREFLEEIEIFWKLYLFFIIFFVEVKGFELLFCWIKVLFGDSVGFEWVLVEFFEVMVGEIMILVFFGYDICWRVC